MMAFRRIKSSLILGLTLTICASGVSAEQSHQTHTSKYAGQEARDIKSLSPEDIAELKSGGGWGLAKAAELNGVPGPAHLLELKDQIPLDPAQIEAIIAIHDEMKTAAISQGETLIALERELEGRFKDDSLTPETLARHLEAIGQARSKLRYIHLATHLKTPEILTPGQVDRYNALRGYAAADPCARVPEGHNADMWRKHNGCQ